MRSPSSSTEDLAPGTPARPLPDFDHEDEELEDEVHVYTGPPLPRMVEALVFDDVVVGTAFAYSSPRWDELLARREATVLHAVVDQVTGTLPTIAVDLMDGSDGRNWRLKARMVSEISLSATATNSFVGYDDSVGPSHGLARIRIVLGGTNPSAHVKIYFCARDRG